VCRLELPRSGLETPKHNDEFSALLIAAIDEGLGTVLDEPTCKGIEYHVYKEVIARSLGSFAMALQTIFGVQGAWLFEDAILRKLYEKVGVKYDANNDIPFEMQVEQLRRLAARKASSSSLGPK